MAASPESLRDVPERIPRQQSVPAIAPAVVPLEEYVGNAFLLVEMYTHVTDLPLGVCMPLARSGHMHRQASRVRSTELARCIRSAASELPRCIRVSSRAIATEQA